MFRFYRIANGRIDQTEFQFYVSRRNLYLYEGSRHILTERLEDESWASIYSCLNRISHMYFIIICANGIVARNGYLRYYLIHDESTERTLFLLMRMADGIGKIYVRLNYESIMSEVYDNCISERTRMQQRHSMLMYFPKIEIRQWSGK